MLFSTEKPQKKFQKKFASDPKIRYNRCMEKYEKMSPKQTENPPLKKTEKEQSLLDKLLERFDCRLSDEELVEELKKFKFNKTEGKL